LCSHKLESFLTGGAISKLLAGSSHALEVPLGEAVRVSAEGILANLGLQLDRLGVDGLDFVGLRALGLLGDFHVEVKVVHEVLAGLHGDFGLLDQLLFAIHFVLQQAPVPLGESDLVQLEENFVEGEESNVFGGAGGDQKFCEERAVSSLVISGDFSGKIGKVLLGHLGGVALLNARGEHSLVGEDIESLRSLSHVLFSFEDLADLVENFGANGGASCTIQVLLDCSDCFLVALPHLFCNLLSHLGEHELQVRDFVPVVRDLLIVSISLSLLLLVLFSVAVLAVSDL